MKLGMIGIIVNDMENAIAFYDCLGIPVKERYSEDYVELESNNVRISLNTKQMIEGIYGFEPKSEGDKIEIAFEVPTPNDVDKVSDAVKTKGYDVFKAPWDAVWDQRYAIVKDPDGNLLSIFCNLDKQ